MASTTRHNPPWTWIAPLFGAASLSLAFLAPGMPGIVLLLVAGLFASVIAAVHHAEVIALKLGEPFGTLVLALSVNKNAYAQVNHGTGGDVSAESRADAGEPLVVRWLPESRIEVPLAEVSVE